jgi:hypothetical protein
MTSRDRCIAHLVTPQHHNFYFSPVTLIPSSSLVASWPGSTIAHTHVPRSSSSVSAPHTQNCQLFYKNKIINSWELFSSESFLPWLPIPTPTWLYSNTQNLNSQVKASWSWRKSTLHYKLQYTVVFKVSASKLRTMELPSLGQQCTEPSCRQLGEWTEILDRLNYELILMPSTNHKPDSVALSYVNV